MLFVRYEMRCQCRCPLIYTLAAQDCLGDTCGVKASRTAERPGEDQQIGELSGLKIPIAWAVPEASADPRQCWSESSGDDCQRERIDPCRFGLSGALGDAPLKPVDQTPEVKTSSVAVTPSVTPASRTFLPRM